MGLETSTYIDGLVSTNPLSADPKSQGDDHIRLLKSTIKTTFPNITGAVTPTHTELNFVDGVTSPIQAQFDNITTTLIPAKGAIAGQAWTGSHTFPTQTAGDNSTKAATTAYVDMADELKANIDSPTFTGDPKAPTPSVGDNDTSIATTAFVRTEFAPIASPTFTGTPSAQTAAAGTNTTQLATTEFVNGAAFSAALPVQAGNSGKVVTTDGSTASWSGLKTIGGNSLLGTGDIPTGIATAASITTSTTLTNASAGYQKTAMTAIGQSVTLPDATTVSIGSPKFYVDNSNGGYPVGIRDSAGALLMAVAAGGTAFVSCQDISTAAGVWSITGTNLEPGLITIDNTFSSTYASTVLKPFVVLDANKSIHFLALASGFAAVAVDKTTGAVGTPVTVSATASMVPRTVFKITSTTAMLFYSSTTGTLIGVVLSLTAPTTLAVGTPSSTLTAAGVAVEDFSGAPKIAQLDSTHYLLSYATNSGAGTTSVAAWEVTSGTTATLGSAVNIIAANNVADSTTTYALTATTGLVIYADNAVGAGKVRAVVISVSGTTCTVNTPAAGADTATTLTLPPMSCLLSATKVLTAHIWNGNQVKVEAITVSGTSVSFGTEFDPNGGTGITEAVASYTGSSATRYNPHLWPISANSAGLWYHDGNGVSRVVVLTESGGTVTKGTIIYRSISTATSNSIGAGAILPMGTSEFMAVRERTADTAGYLTDTLIPCKIAGTTITQGNSSSLSQVLPVAPASVTSVRLPSGDYVFPAAYADMAPSGIDVFRSNGDVISYRGTIQKPSINVGTAYPVAAVSSNRIVLLGATPNGTTVGISTFQLRLLSIEIAK